VRLAAAGAALLLFPATAGAAAWSPPQRLSGPHFAVDTPALVASGNGRALATWRFHDSAGNPARTGFSDASRAPGAAAFGRPRALTPVMRVTRPLEIVQGVGAYGRRGAVLAVTKPATSGAAPRVRLSVRFGRTDGTFGRRITIRRPGSSFKTASSIARVSLAVNARGDAALAWFEDRGVRTDRVYVALRRAGHAFGKPRRLATDRVRNVAAAIGASGDVLVAWDARGVLRTRFKPRRRASFRRTDTIRSEQAFFADLHPTVTLNGRAVLAWSAQFASEGGTRGPVFFEAAVRVASGQRFRRAQLLERIDDAPGAERPIDAVATIYGGVTIAWSGAGGAVRAARVEQSGAVGPAQDVGTGVLSDLATGAGGRVLAVWDDGVEARPSTVHAAQAEAEQPFGPAEAVSAPGEDAHFGAAAYSRGVPTIVYSGRPEPTRSFAEATTRAG
jgi:hypothetical protein